MNQFPWHVRAGSILSQLVNTLVFNGLIDQTLSSRAYTDQHTSKFWAFVRRTADRLIGEDHCKGAFEADEAFAHEIWIKRVQLTDRGIE